MQGVALLRGLFHWMCDALVACGRAVRPFVQFPAAYHPRRSELRCTDIEIDQVEETSRVIGGSAV